MRRSFSISYAAVVLAAVLLALVPAPTRAAETLADSLAAELELARGSAVYLVVDVEQARLEVRSRGVVLDQVPIRRLGLRSRQPLLATRHDAATDLPAVVKIARSAPQRREIVIAGNSQDGTGGASEGPPALATPTVDGHYACLLDNGWLLQLRDRGEGSGFWRRLRKSLSDPFARVPGPRTDRPALVIELASGDAKRLRHLFRRDRTLLIR